MILQPVTKSSIGYSAFPQESLPALNINLSTGQYNLTYTPAASSSAWLMSTRKKSMDISLGVPIDRLLHFVPAVGPLSSFLAKVEDRIACQLSDKPGVADLKMIRTARNIVHCPYTGIFEEVYCDLQLSNLLTMALAGIAGQTPGNKLTLKPLDVEKVEATRHYLMDNMDKPPTLVRLARKMGLNDFKLKKAYKQLYGTTLFEDFLHARMDKARGLLEDTDLSIVGIAERVGYKNVSSFSVAFKKYFGYPPGEHRKRL